MTTHLKKLCRIVIEFLKEVVMKYLMLLVTVIVFLSCEKNPLDNDYKIYESIEYTVTVKILSEEGTPLSNAWIEGFAYGSSDDYYANDNGEILIRKIQHVSEGDNIPEFLSISSFIYPCEFSNDDRLVRNIQLNRGNDYLLFIIECSFNDKDNSTMNTL